jgi:NAD-specific glutamate dehydrogenase
MKRITIFSNEIPTDSARFQTEQQCLDWKDANTYRFAENFTFEIVDAQAEVDSEEALKFLNETDYKVLRHLGQKALNISTTLTEQEYLDLEAERQSARSKVL